MNKMKLFGAAFLLMTLAACGKVGPLESKAGQAPPDKVFGQSEVPNSNALTTASEQSRPGRSDELMRRSERRADDPFDLPPGSEAADTQDKSAKPETLPIVQATQPE